jgi:hypothetical protein
MKAIKEKAMSNIAMSNETDLDWLARNVTKKQLSAGGFIKKDARGCNGILHIAETPKSLGWYFSSEVSDRRAELQNKPSWKDAPEWANWMAQSPRGHWEFFSANPRANHLWMYSVGERSFANNIANPGAILGDWRDTLERRPKDLSEPAVTARLQDATDNVRAAIQELKSDKYKFQPLINIEDNQEQDMTQQSTTQQAEKQQDNSWLERGELPPVGTVCLYVVSDRLSAEVEITAHAKFGICFVRVGQSGESYASKTAELHRFRPIRTEREKQVGELESLLKSTCLASLDNLDVIAAAIYAAGYRKDPK